MVFQVIQETFKRSHLQVTGQLASLAQLFFVSVEAEATSNWEMFVLILTWERAGGSASQQAPDLHLRPADGDVRDR